MSSANCPESKNTAASTGTSFGLLIAVVLYILLVIILSSLKTY